MNKIKRICTLLLAITLTLGLAVSRFGIGGVFASDPDQGVVVADTPADVVAIDPNDYIYFDLAAGNITIGKDTYSGAVYVNGTSYPISGTHEAGNHYYIYQSNKTDTASVGYYTKTGYTSTTEADNHTNCTVPNYARVAYDGKSWSNYVTNNIDVYTVSNKWDIAAKDAKREGTDHRIIFAPASDYSADVTIDNIWSTYYQASTSRQNGGIGAHLDNQTGTLITLRMKGDNRVGCVHYSADKGSGNKIKFYNGDSAETPGSITAADFSKNWRANHWNAVIGAADNPGDSADMSDGIEIHSGVIYAGATWEDNCTAIGGGGNQYGSVTIKGGTVTAVTAGTGTAIGGGIGYSDQGGDADVNISGGDIYAYNLGIDKTKTGGFDKFVPSSAIGGGGSNNQAGGLKVSIEISGGNVYAQSVGGPGIGGGSSANSNGGPATIKITGGTIIAKSVAGTYDSVDVSAGVSIGGGTGLTRGGSVDLTIGGADTVIRTGSIGGGESTGKDASGNPLPVGSATVNVSGGDIVGQIIMAGGAENSCSFTMTDGWIHGTDVINGNTVEEKYNDPQKDVKLEYKRENGGAVFMNDPGGVATVSGGIIEYCKAQNGGAIYMAGGICNLSESGGLGTNSAVENGGAIYVEKGTVNVSGGGHINENSAVTGGGMYVGNGTINISGGEIYDNIAQKDGGGMYVGGGEVIISKEANSDTVPEIFGNTAKVDGGGMYVGSGNVTISGGDIRENHAMKNGGGMYVGNGEVNVSGGSLRNNTAVLDGGGAYVAGNYFMTDGNVSSNKATNGGGLCVNDGIVILYGGNVDSNTATESGGGMYVSSTLKDAFVDIFSGSVSFNKAKSGGGVSVVSDEDTDIHVTVGVNCVHPDLNDKDRMFDSFAYPSPADCGEAHELHTHHIPGLTHSSCPLISYNIGTDVGGGFYLRSPNTDLIFYCVIARGNIAHGNKQSYDLDVLGGNVEIGDKTYDPNQAEPVKGNIVMEESIYVEGGTVDVYGTVTNPKFTDDITVEITDPTHHYIDHRISNNAYKVHYYENFKGDGDIPTGLYIARQYPDKGHEASQGDEKYEFTVMASIFSHPGYKIVGWNTDPNGNGTEYKVNETYNLKTLDSEGKIGADIEGVGHDGALLVIYALWERSGYVLKFDPNVGAGETYTGTMENQRVTVGQLDGSQAIAENLFRRTGYMFLGWTLTATQTETVEYRDGHKITKDFTGEDGATVTLYAQWKICTHVDFLEYTANENVLTQSCTKCDGHTATATVTAVNSNYDGDYHLASASFSSKWIGDKPVITYVLAPNTEWDGKDDIDDLWTSDPRPLHAGLYTAKVAVGEVTAQAEYEISQVKWDTPAVPKVVFSVIDATTSVITITEPIGEGICYKISRYDTSTNTIVELPEYADWQTEKAFNNIPFGYYYYFYAKMSADRDHSESESSQSNAYLATGGNVVYVENDIGIKVVATSGDGSFTYTVSADSGYHLRGYRDNAGTAVADRQPLQIGATYSGTGIRIASTTLETGKKYEYTVTIDNAVTYYQITLEFRGAAKNATVTHKVTDGQVFGDFNDKVTSISRDSAFTAQFTVIDYIPEEYQGQELRFSPAIPDGTTIIMKTSGGYWYYKSETDLSAVSLSEFTQMGANEKFTFTVTEGLAKTTKSFTYQFIIDFSQTATRLNIGALEVQLGLTADAAFSAPDIPSAGVSQISLSVQGEAEFGLSESVDGKSATLTCTYTASQGDASIWKGRNTALVLTAAPDTVVPADLTLTAVTDGSTTLYTMHSGNRFIIPLGGLVATKSVTVTLHSDLFGTTAESLNFTADWYVSQSGAEKSPLNGYKAGSCAVPFTCKKEYTPSVRIDGDTHICHAGGVLNVTVNFAGIPSEGSITAYLQGKKDGVYVDTGAKVAIDKDVGTSKQTSFNMGQMDKGSYRILVIVQVSGANILQVPYYFTIV